MKSSHNLSKLTTFVAIKSAAGDQRESPFIKEFFKLARLTIENMHGHNLPQCII